MVRQRSWAREKDHFLYPNPPILGWKSWKYSSKPSQLRHLFNVTCSLQSALLQSMLWLPFCKETDEVETEMTQIPWLMIVITMFKHHWFVIHLIGIRTMKHQAWWYKRSNHLQFRSMSLLAYVRLKQGNMCYYKLPGMWRVLAVSKVYKNLVHKLNHFLKLTFLCLIEHTLLSLIMAKTWRWLAFEAHIQVISIISLLWVSIIWEL